MSTTDSQGESWPELVRATKTIVVADVVESVRMMQANEADVIDRWRRFVHEVRSRVLPSRQGRMVKSLGDGMLLEFETVPAGASAALEIQRCLGAFNQGRPPHEALLLRIGVHASEVVTDELDIYGTGVNLAARLAGLAEPGGIVVSTQVRDQLLPGLDAHCEDLGECWLKNLNKPVRAWRVRPAAEPNCNPMSLPPDRMESRAAIAILPLQDSSSRQEGLALGEFVAEELITRLTRVPYLAVISSLSTVALKGRSISPRELASVLGVRYVVQGSCLLMGERLRFHLELIDAGSQAVVWAHSDSASLAEMMTGECPQLADVVTQLARALVGAEALLTETRPLPTLDSFSLLLGAIAKLHRLTAEDFQRAYTLLEMLVERHPRSPIPRAWLGKWYVMRIGQGWSPDPAVDGQRAAYNTACALDLQPDHPLSLTLDGFVAGYVRHEFDVAEQRYGAALGANPSESLAWLFKSAMLGYREEHAAATACVERAMSLSPLDPMRYYYEHFAALIALLAGDCERAVVLGERSLAGNRSHASTLRVLVMALALIGQEARARQLGQELMKLEPTLTQRGFRRRYPGQREAQVSRLLQALAIAGIPRG